jgi:hypothetical protein
MNHIKQVRNLIKNGIDKKSNISLLFHNNDKTYLIYLVDTNIILEYFFHNKNWLFNVHNYSWYQSINPSHSSFHHQNHEVY